MNTGTIRFTFTALYACFGILFIRLFHLQVHQADELYLKSKKNYTRIEKIASPRGNIVDTHGQLLATNRPIHILHWQGTGNKKLSEEQQKTIALLYTILDTPCTDELVHAIQHAERHNVSCTIAQDLTFEQLSQIAEQCTHNKNIRIENTFKRHYPHQTLACHIVGYLGQIHCDPIGKMGIEKVLEEKLKGQKGEIEKTINSIGKSLSERLLKQAQAGTDIHTTLDLALQKIAEQAFPIDKAGTIIIMDPKNGALRAIFSRPAFDPSLFLQSIQKEQWYELIEKKAFLNRAFDACYPPASIFKLVTVSAALEKGIVSPDSHVFCSGSYQFGSTKQWCHQHLGHGTLSVKQALAHSCNILFYHIGKQISIDTLADYAHRFGLGQRTNGLFPEAEGLIPNSSWKLKYKHERWWPGETLSAAIGQSYLLVTPIQIARMIGSIFEGYLATPRIIEEEEVHTTPLMIRPSTREFLKSSMRAVITMGTGIRLSHIKHVEIYAKTGTAQTSSLSLRDQNDAYLEHAWFVAYFTHKKDPLVLVILVENAGASRVAANIAHECIIKYVEQKENS